MTDKNPLKPARRWLLGIGIAAGLAGLLAVLAVRLVPSDEELAQRAKAALEAKLGVPVSIGRLRWSLLPVPTVEIEQLATGQEAPVEISLLRIELDRSMLWQRRLRAERVQVMGAVVPQRSLRGLGNPSAAEPAQLPALLKAFVPDELPMARIEFQGVTWISRRGTRLVYAGEADFDTGWRPRLARMHRPDAATPADITLARQGQEDRWSVRANVGGGTAHGELRLRPDAARGWRLAGTLKPSGIDLVSALDAFGRRSILAGKLSGDTTLSAHGQNMGELAQSLHTTTAFSMGRSTLLRFDLDKAIRSLGRDPAGSTPLDAVSGQLDTQNTPQGMVASYTDLKTRSGALSASGKTRVANRQIDGELAVDLVDGVVGIPLLLSGPVEKVQVSVPPSALAGAAVGTAVMPGIGTALGARIGSAIGRMLSPEPAGKRHLAPVEK